GPLREPLKAIQRANVLIIIQPFGAGGGSIDCSVLGFPDVNRVLHAQIRPSSLVYSNRGIWCEAPLMAAGRQVTAVSGIANPAQFHAMISALGAKLVRTVNYRDHHDYRVGDWKDILDAARQTEMIITTEKDLVKLERFTTREIPLYALRLRVTMGAREETQLLRLVTARIRRDAGLRHLERKEERSVALSQDLLDILACP